MIDNFFPQDIIEEKIKSYSQYKAKWYLGKGIPIKDYVILKAVNLYRMAKGMGFYTEVFPVMNGGVNLSFMWKNSDYAIDVMLKSNLIMDMVCEKGIGESYDIISEKENATIDDLFLFLNETRKKCTSESYPSHITMNPSNVFKVVSSSTLLKKKEGAFRLLIVNAPKEQKNQEYVNISENTMISWLEPQSYSGFLNPMIYNNIAQTLK